MLESLIIVGTQVAIIFILIILGFFGQKIKMITEEGVNSMNNIMLNYVTPCVIINAFQREFETQLLKNLLISISAAVLSHALCFVLGALFIHNKDNAKQRVLRFTVIFSNCGFMALPLLNALLGSEGVFYGASYLAVFNLFVWSFGQYLIGKGQGGFDIKKAVFNPGVIAVVVGLIFFFASFTLPEIIGSPVKYISDLNTPLAMLIIGYTIATLDLKEIIRLRSEIPALILRLLVSPLILLLILYVLGIRGTLLVSTIVSASTPVAAISTMFSIKYNVDKTLSAKMVAISTLFSIITMTLIVGFARYIA